MKMHIQLHLCVLIFLAYLLLFTLDIAACEVKPTSVSAPGNVSASSDATSVNSTYGDPVDITTGAHFVDRKELVVPGNIEMAINCKLFSNIHSFSHFGHGWMWEMDMRLCKMKQAGSNDIYAIRGPEGEIHQFDINGHSINLSMPKDSLVFLANNNFMLQADKDKKYYFDANGLLLKVADKNGNAIIIEYEKNQQTQSVGEYEILGTDVPSGKYSVMATDARPVKIYTNDDTTRCITFIYNDKGYIERATDFTGRSYNYEYSDYGNLVKITDPLGNVKHYNYEISGKPHLLSGYTKYSVDPYESTEMIRIEYDGYDRVVKQYDRGYEYDFAYADSTVDEINLVVNGQTVRKNITVTAYTIQEYNKSTGSYEKVREFFHVDSAISFTPALQSANRVIVKSNSYKSINLNGNVEWVQVIDRFEFNDKNSFVKEVSPDGSFRAYQYDSKHRITKLETHQPDGSTIYTRMEYAGDRTDTTRVVRGLKNGDSSVVTYVYDNYSNIDTMRKWFKNDSCLTTVFTRDLRGRIISKIENGGYKTIYEYDGGDTSGPGFLTKEIRPGIGSYDYEVDALGRITKIIDPQARQTYAFYDALDRVVEKIDAVGIHTLYYYNGIDLFKTVEGVLNNNLGIPTVNQYDKYGRLLVTKKCMENGDSVAVYVATYDSAGNVLTVGDEVGTTAWYGYDGNGKKVWAKNVYDKYERYAYDANGIMRTLKDRKGHFIETVFDNSGKLIKKTDANNIAKPANNRNSEYFYYNYFNMLDSLVDVNGHTIKFYYDRIGRLTKKTDALGNSIVCQYNSQGQQTLVVQPDSQTIAMVYDSAGRVVEKNYSANDSANTFYTYDCIGNLLSVMRGTSKYAAAKEHSYAYDGMNRLLVDTNYTLGTSKIIRYEYDHLGRKVRRIDAEGVVVDYVYNNLGQLTTIKQNDTTQASYAYCVCGALESKTYGNGIEVEYLRDNARRLTDIVVWNRNDSAILRLKYEIDDVGNILKMIRNGSDTSIYDYDSNYQVVYAKYPNGLIQQFYYDEAGNRTRLVETGIQSSDVNYTYNAMNQIDTMDNGTGFDYDKLGNMVRKKSAEEDWKYQYWPENRMTLVLKNDTNVKKIKYDFSGKRIAEYSSADTIRIIWDDNWNIIADYHGNASLDMKYLTGLQMDEYVMQKDIAGSEKLYLLQDRINSVIGLVDTSCAVVKVGSYEAFGNTGFSNIGDKCRFGFTGRELVGQVGLYNYRMRWYDGMLGKFSQRDPIELHGGDFNFYRYVKNSPLVMVDNLGLKPVSAQKQPMLYEAPGTPSNLYGAADYLKIAGCLPGILCDMPPPVSANGSDVVSTCFCLVYNEMMRSWVEEKCSCSDYR